MSVTPAQPITQKPQANVITLTVIILVVVLGVPAAQLHQTFGDVLALSVLVLGVGSAVTKCSKNIDS